MTWDLAAVSVWMTCVRTIRNKQQRSPGFRSWAFLLSLQTQIVRVASGQPNGGRMATKSSLKFIGFTVRGKDNFPAFAVVFAETPEGVCYAIYPSGDMVKLLKKSDCSPETRDVILGGENTIVYRSGEPYVYDKRNINFGFSEDDLFIGRRQMLRTRFKRRLKSLKALPERTWLQQDCLMRYEAALESLN